MRNTVLSLLVLLLSPLNVVARDMLGEAAGKIAAAPSLTTRFEANDSSGKVTGEAVMAGRSFVIVTDNGDYETWFDGKTQWTYNAAAGEVSMTEPTEAEILEINPLAIISDVAGKYRISELTADKPGTTKYRLIPTDKNSPVSSAEVYIDSRSGWPVEIHAKLPGGDNISLRFNDTKAGGKIAPDRFRYNPAFHPMAEIIDLR